MFMLPRVSSSARGFLAMAAALTIGPPASAQVADLHGSGTAYFSPYQQAQGVRCLSGLSRMGPGAPTLLYSQLWQGPATGTFSPAWLLPMGYQGSPIRDGDSIAWIVSTPATMPWGDGYWWVTYTGKVAIRPWYYFDTGQYRIDYTWTAHWLADTD